MSISAAYRAHADIAWQVQVYEGGGGNTTSSPRRTTTVLVTRPSSLYTDPTQLTHDLLTH